MKRCPSCNQLLIRRFIQQIEVDGCPSCGGAWLDDGELKALGQASADNLRTLEKLFVAGSQPAIGGRRTNQCPVCNEPLTPFEYGSLAGIELDGCRSCKGVWLDDGEAAAIANRLDPAPVPTATPAPADDSRIELGPRGAVPVSAASTVQPAVRSTATSTADPTATAHLPVVRGQQLGHVGHPSGFGGRINAAFGFIKAAYALAFECKTLLIPILLGFVANGLLLAAVFGVFWLVTGGNLAALGDDGEGVGVFGSLAAVALAFALQLINTFSLATTVSMVDAYLKGMEPSLKIAMSDAVKNLGGLVALAVVGTIIQMLTNGMRRNRGMFSRMLAGSVDRLWTVASFLLLPIIMIEDVGLGTALGRAKDLHRRNVLQIAVGEIGLGIVQFVIAMGGLLVGFLTYYALAGVLQGAAAVAVSIGVGLFVFMSLGLFNTFARGAYYTCLYLWAVETERAGETAMVPGPLAAVLR